MKPPRRRCKLTLEIEADSIEDLQQGLMNFTTMRHIDGYSSQGMSAGYRDSFSYTFSEDESITPESWREHLEKYIKQLNSSCLTESRE